MGILDEINKEAPELGILADMEGRVPVKGHTRKKRSSGVGAAIGGTVGGIGGAAGGTLVAPGVGTVGGGLLGAGVGGAAGEAFEQGLQNTPASAGLNPVGAAIMGLLSQGADPGEIARAGAEQAAMEAAGGVVGAGVKLAGRPLMQAALKVAPEAAQTAVAAGAAATKEGLKKIKARLGDAGQVALNLTRMATAQGIKHDAKAIDKEIYREMTAGMKGLPGDKARRETVSRIGLSFLEEQGMGTMSPTQLHLAKQRADDLAAPIHKALAMGQKVNSTDQLAARWYKNFADKARALLEPIPGYKDVNDVTSAIIQAKQALDPATRKGLSISQAALQRGALPTAGAVVGATAGATRGEGGVERALNSAIGGAVGAGAMTPRALSLLALQTQHPLVANILASIARIGKTASEQGEEY